MRSAGTSRRVTVYLRSGLHDELISALEGLPRGYRASRFRDLLTLGQQALALEGRGAGSLYADPSLPAPVNASLRVYLVTDRSIARPQSQSDITRISAYLADLATKGLRREATFHYGSVGAAISRTPSPRQSSTTHGELRARMRMMVRALDEGEPP